MRDMIKIIVGVLVACLMLPACTQDDRVETTPNTDKLSFGISLSGSVARSLSEDNESTLDWIDVFLIKDGAIITKEHVTNPPTVVYLDADKNNYVDKVPFDLYVIANSGETFSDKVTLEQLKEMTETTAFYEDATPDHFLMDGHTEVTDVNSDIVVNLKRAAAKIVVNLEYGEETVDGVTYTYTATGTLQKQIVDYATTTSILEEGQSLSVDARNLATTGLLDNPTSDNEKVVFYSYANDWNFSSNDSEQGWDNETYLVLNVPVTVNGTDFHPNNYYRINLNGFMDDKDGENSLQRNYLYEINAIVKTLGSGKPDTPYELKDIKFKVDDWTNKYIEIGGKDKAHYLVLNKDAFEINNVESDASLEFTSSSQVSVQLLECYYVDKLGVTRYIASSDPYKAIGGDKITDENGNEVEKFPASDYEPEFTPDQENKGKINMSSKLLVNTPKYITIRVSNGDKDTQDVTIVQYPLEYITPIRGYQSYRTDFGGTTYDSYGAEGIVCATISNGRWDYTTDYKPIDRIFASKVVKTYDTKTGESTIGYYQYDNSGTKSDGDNSTTLKNANMYQVRLTSASNKYTLSKPQVDDNGYTINTSENAELVSPSFMIASQLGGVTVPNNNNP